MAVNVVNVRIGFEEIYSNTKYTSSDGEYEYVKRSTVHLHKRCV